MTHIDEDQSVNGNDELDADNGKRLADSEARPPMSVPVVIAYPTFNQIHIIINVDC